MGMGIFLPGGDGRGAVRELAKKFLLSRKSSSTVAARLFNIPWNNHSNKYELLISINAQRY